MRLATPLSFTALAALSSPAKQAFHQGPRQVGESKRPLRPQRGAWPIAPAACSPGAPERRAPGGMPKMGSCVMQGASLPPAAAAARAGGWVVGCACCSSGRVLPRAAGPCRAGGGRKGGGPYRALSRAAVGPPVAGRLVAPWLESGCAVGRRAAQTMRSAGVPVQALGGTHLPARAAGCRADSAPPRVGPFQLPQCLLAPAQLSPGSYACLASPGTAHDRSPLCWALLLPSSHPGGKEGQFCYSHQLQIV